MSSRPGIELTARVEADGGETPNAFIPWISAHVRVYWPPLATEAQIEAALSLAVHDAREAIKARREL